MSKPLRIHEIPLALLKACGIDAEKVRSLTFRADVDSVPEIEVTYLVTHGDPAILGEHTAKFRQVFETEPANDGTVSDA